MTRHWEWEWMARTTGSRWEDNLSSNRINNRSLMILFWIHLLLPILINGSRSSRTNRLANTTMSIIKMSSIRLNSINSRTANTASRRNLSSSTMAFSASSHNSNHHIQLSIPAYMGKRHIHRRQTRQMLITMHSVVCPVIRSP